MPTESLFGSVAIGKDTSGNFKLSPFGLAVRSGADGKFVARYRDELVDVTGMTFDGTENLVYRIPKKHPIPKKDIVVRSDNPFSILFVDALSSEGILTGTDPDGNIQDTRPVTNILTQALVNRAASKQHIHLFVTVVGPDSLFREGRDQDLLPLLLLGSQGGAGAATDPLSTIFLLRSLGQDLDEKALATLSLLKGGALSGGGNDQLALLLALQGSDLFATEKSSSSHLKEQESSYLKEERPKK